MKTLALIGLVALPGVAAWAENPDDMFSGTTVVDASPAAPQGAAPGAENLLQSKGVELGGTLFSDFTTFAYWPGSYPQLSNPASGRYSSFVPNLEADLYFDARPYTYFRVFGKLKAVYPFASAAAANLPTTIYSAPPSPVGAPAISVFELFADVNYNEALFLRVGQQVIHWGVGRFFSPADILSLTPINPLQPTLERQGPLALSITVPFAGVDNAYLYVIANQASAGNGAFQPSELAVAPKVEVVLGDFEVGLGGYYQKDQRPKAMTTVTGSLFGTFGIFGEGVVSYGSDRVLAQPVAGSPGVYQAATDTTTPYFSGTVGASYENGSQHISAFVQYYYNGQGYSDLSQEQAAVGLYGTQQAALAAGSTLAGPLLSPTDLLLPGRHYLAASVAWTDIRASNVDLGLFYEGNLSDSSGVVSPFISYTPFLNCTVTVAPYIGHGDTGSEFVTRFGYFALSLKVMIGEGGF